MAPSCNTQNRSAKFSNYSRPDRKSVTTVTPRAAKGHAQGYYGRHGTRSSCNTKRSETTTLLMSPPRAGLTN